MFGGESMKFPAELFSPTDDNPLETKAFGAEVEIFNLNFPFC